MKRVAVITVLLFVTTTVFAQSDDGERTLSQINFIWGQPEGALAERIDANPIGANLLFGGRAPGLPLFLGTEAGFLNYGMVERLDVFEFEEVPVQAATSSMSQNILMTHLVARLQPPTGPIQPYLDALGGLKYFITRSSIQSDVLIFREGLHASARVTDWALSYGVGAGLDIQLFESRFGLYDRRGIVSLNIGARYLFGTEADYVTQGVFDENTGTFQFDTERSATDLLVSQVGIRIQL